MLGDTIWITGVTRSGKTSRLVTEFCRWVEEGKRPVQGRRGREKPGILVFAANDDNRRELADKLAAAINGRYPVLAKTPIGFFQDEVMLFWPLLIQRLNLRAQFPLRLRPETEQELATRLWRLELDNGNIQITGVNEYRFVRRVLDLLQLAGTSGTPPENIPSILEQGGVLQESFAKGKQDGTRYWKWIGELLLSWRSWCLERGLLSYGIIYELYWRYLLQDSTYQQHLKQRYQAVLADDVDDYPAIARDLFDLLLDAGARGAFTYNIDGAVRLGLNADPKYLEGLKARCKVETLTQPAVSCLADSLREWVVECVEYPSLMSLPDSVQSIQTTSRASLLRQTAEAIADAVRCSEVQPQEIAVIAPGLDAISRYALTEILTSKEIPVESLNSQRPLNSSPAIRALLTLLALVYPDLGRLVDRDAIAEMLVVLSNRHVSNKVNDDEQENSPFLPWNPDIDFVRAGMLADYCYAPHPNLPQLLPVTAFPRWDRLGYRAASAYDKILQWLDEQRSQQEARLIPSAIVLLDRAIQQFFLHSSNLPYDQIAALRELMETAQHWWEVDGRLRKSEQLDNPAHTTIAQFIILLRKGTITANPYPVRLGESRNAVTLANIFQYRASRRFHKWQFWLDASSPFWLSGGAATLFGAPLFLKNWEGRIWTEEDTQNADLQRLQRILRDLLGRTGERLYLCHSDLAVNGQEQIGPLLPLVNASVPKREREGEGESGY